MPLPSSARPLTNPVPGDRPPPTPARGSSRFRTFSGASSLRLHRAPSSLAILRICRPGRALPTWPRSSTAARRMHRVRDRRSHARSSWSSTPCAWPPVIYVLEPGAIFHTDRGSVGRVDSCFDNAQAESFNATLKVERVNRTVFPQRRHPLQLAVTGENFVTADNPLLALVLIGSATQLIENPLPRPITRPATMPVINGLPVPVSTPAGPATQHHSGFARAPH